MLRIALFSLLSGLLVIAPSAHAASNADTCRTYSAAFLKALENGNYAAATTHFNAKMKAAASAQMMAQFWQSLPTKNNLGSYEHAGSARLIHYGSAVIVDTPLQFTHGRKVTYCIILVTFWLIGNRAFSACCIERRHLSNVFGRFPESA